MEQQKQVGIWIRVSTEDQAQGDSPEHHEKRARLYAEAKGWEVKTVYHLEALSGKSVMAYAETKRMLEDIRSGFITGLIFSKLARLARNTKELLEFADIFKVENADLVSLQEAIDTSSPAGRLFYTMIAAMAQWEREEIASRVVASIPIRAKMGKHLGGKPSLGYKWIGGKGETKQLVIDEQYAPVRKLVYELFIKHKRKKAVARILNEQGYRTRSGTKFSDGTVSLLLRDSMAKGERKSNFTDSVGGKKSYTLKPTSEWVITKCPAIVSEELWNECNVLLDQLEKKRDKLGKQTKELLAGYVKCETCKGRMYVYHQTKSPSYVCTKCNTRIHVEDLDFIFKDQLKEFLLTDTTISKYLEKIDTQLREKGNLLLVISEERDKLRKKAQDMVNMRLEGEWSKELFAQHFKPVEERILQIDNQLPELEAEIDFMKIQHHSSDVVISEARDLYSKWDTMEYEEKRTVVEIITDEIIVGKQDIHIQLSYLPSKNTNTKSPGANAPGSAPAKNQTSHLQSENPVKKQTDVRVGV